MLKLDNNLLDELGLGGLPEDQKRPMLQHIYETLELRVGTNLANQMSDQQLEEFERFIDDGGDANQAQALQWLEANLPNYKDVVNQVFEELKGEIKQMAPQLMTASAQPPAIVQQQPQYSPQTQPNQRPMPPAPPQPDYGAPTPVSMPPVQQPTVLNQPYAQQEVSQMPQTAPVQAAANPAAQPAMPQQPYPPLATTDQSGDQQQAQAADAVIAQPPQFPGQQPPAGPSPLN